MDDYANECLQGAQFGMDGKTLIHPKQIEGANAAFAPSSAQVSHPHFIVTQSSPHPRLILSQVESSRRMIAAHAEALARGDGVLVMDGRLVENLHVANAERIVEMADAIAAAG